MKFFLFLLLNCFHFMDAKYNRIIRVDGINPTCNQRPDCRDYEIDGALINIDKSLPYMNGDSPCCLEFEAEDEENQYFMVRVLSPTFLGGNDYITFFRNDFRNPIANVTAIDKNPYRVIYSNSSKIFVEFRKDKDFRSTFDILITAYYDGSSRYCLKDKTMCEQSNMCIDKDLECDRFPHCPENEDEEKCNNAGNIKFDEDLRPSVSIALSIVIGIICVMIVSSVVCCMCRRKANSASFNSNPLMRMFGYSVNRPSYQRNPPAATTNNNQRASSAATTASPPQQQEEVRLNMTHINRNKPTATQQATNRTCQNPPPPSYEEVKLLNNNE